MFGEIQDVEMGEDGSIVVLDEQPVAVTRFSSRGEVLGSYRATGEGPGEMRQPDDIELMGDTALVLDSRNMRIHILEATQTDFEYRGAIPLPIPVWSFCQMDGRIYLHVLLEDHLLHEVTWDGEIVRSFAPVPQIPRNLEGLQGNPVFRLFWSNGPVACFDHAGVIVSIGAFSPLLRTFSRDGELLWEAEVADHKPGVFQTSEGIDVDWKFADDGSHVAMNLLDWNRNSFLLQLDVRHPVANSGAAPESMRDSRLIDLGDGTELARTDTLPPLRDAAGNRFASWSHDPFPHVLIYERR